MTSDLWPQQGFLGPSSVNPQDGCDVMKIPVDLQQFTKYSEKLIWYQQPCSPHSKSRKSQFLHHFDAPFELQQVVYTTSTVQDYIQKYGIQEFNTGSRLKIAKTTVRCFVVFFFMFFLHFLWCTSTLTLPGHWIETDIPEKTDYGWPDEVLQVVAFLAALSASSTVKINCNTVTVDTAYYCRAQQIGRGKKSISFSDTH